ncbi:MAG: hypothetical protein LCH38_02550 [Proteobacteria bacterium]|nr:hypothetical protein [Pseudomonadota bacterium]
MAKIAFLVHIVLMTVLMGVLVIAVVTVPSLAEQAKTLIPLSAAVGFVLAIPFSVLISKRILALTNGR